MVKLKVWPGCLCVQNLGSVSCSHRVQSAPEGFISTNGCHLLCPEHHARSLLSLLSPLHGVPTPGTSTHHLLPPSCPSRAGAPQTLDLRVVKKLLFAETQLELASTPWGGMEQEWPEEPVGRDISLILAKKPRTTTTQRGVTRL